MRIDPGFPEPGLPTNPRWRIQFDAATLADQEVSADRVGQRDATVTIDNDDANAGYVAAVEAATELTDGCQLQLSYDGVTWRTQLRGVVVAPVYTQGRVTIGIRVVPVAFYPTDRAVAPQFNHLPQPDARVVGTEGTERVTDPRVPSG